MAPETPSNIRVFIRWHDQTVFAGEEVKCTITFKNVTPGPGQSKQPPQQSERSRLASPLHGRPKPSQGLTPPPSASSGRGHRRSALSLSVPASQSHSRTGSVQWPSSPSSSDRRSNHSHKRSVSIVSIGSNNTVEDHTQRNDLPARPQRPHRGHGRASSLQIIPRAQSNLPTGPHSASFSPRLSSSPLFHASYPPPDRIGRVSRPPITSHASNIAGQRRASPQQSPSEHPMPEFRFPAAPSPSREMRPSLSRRSTNENMLSPRNAVGDPNGLAMRLKDGVPTISEQSAPAARILASSGILGGTPRSSGEFYSVSNNSSETLVSEYVTQQPANRGHGRPLRRSLGMPAPQSRAPESLMMGYAQLQGSFSLDGSLVSLSQFDQVKKKAIVGQGGGVVGLETKRDSGLLGGFGWGRISSSLGDLLGGGELSTIKEMRGVANSKSVPLLTTPQSILFVDLQLAPGESRVFEYSFRLPKGLPPSHRGKTVKITYSLVIGTQRAGGTKEQQVKSVEVPFRVLGSVNSHGEILGHDLMNPYILLQDQAQVKSPPNSDKSGSKTNGNAAKGQQSALNDFLLYVEDLVHRPRDESGSIVLSPGAGNSRRPSAYEEASTAHDSIHMAIMRSNMTSGGQQSPNRFEIARNGLRVGVVMLTRPAYRLGEVVTMAIDFTDADIPCYAVHTTLETSEKVDPSLAIRSESSIHRVTRKVYSSSSEATMYSRRVTFKPTIPITATPEFVTSGVSLEWKIRIEFVVPSTGNDSPEEGERRAPHPLLEQIAQDNKGGTVLVAVENLICESFEIAVPLRVYGAVGTGLERLERDEASEEGLAV
ncbi:related to RGP1 Reduced growth phenotype protein [Fusarium torulosum]|uniref:Related to RGP1 Reduced growth phenotype protein n=1 Tax=Fusarium torulosum TaxID=33205 RepID=A0AAE8M761_9HYPO|nr:related to RGP1 Reduced growth phenotype protein [Fusarium torulosum]